MKTMSCLLPESILLLLLPAILSVPFPAGAATDSELTVKDFDFCGGPLGSEGATIEKVAGDHFKVALTAAPGHPTWANNLQFRIVRHARGHAPRLDVVFPCEKPQFRFHEYFHSWSYDGKTWQPLQWQLVEKADTGRRATLQFPTFTEDRVLFGLQVPLPYETLVPMIKDWAKKPCVKVHILGKSIGGKNLYRLTVTDPKSPHAEAARWVHLFTQQHPGEHNSRWRMVGMLEWLLSEAGSDCRCRSICHFIFLMSPDGPSKGWYRVNVAGVDMNRSYRAAGADPREQTQEAYILQKDLETIMASKVPVTDLWSMHTWSGIVEAIAMTGPEMGTLVGPWTDFRDYLQRNDPKNLLKPLKVSEKSEYNGITWTDGPHKQFGITSVLCEGSGGIYTKEENVESGKVIMKSLAEYYKATRPLKP